MIEDPLYLPKDTRVFILTSAQKESHIISKQKLVAEFRVFGYSPTIQYYPTVSKVVNNDIGFDLAVSEANVGMNGVLQWYAYWSVLLKARKLEKHFIIAFSSVSNFKKDVPRSVLNHRMLSMGNPKISTSNYVHVMDHVGAQNILNSIERESVDIFTQAPDRLVFGK